jgi:hypothetical protein
MAAIRRAAQGPSARTVAAPQHEAVLGGGDVAGLRLAWPVSAYAPIMGKPAWSQRHGFQTRGADLQIGPTAS